MPAAKIRAAAAAKKPSMIHASLIKSGSKDPSLYNHLITLYSKTPSTLSQSLKLFNSLPFKPTQVSWTSIISAHSLTSPSTSLSLFTSMLHSHSHSQYSLPNQGTISSLLKTFASSSSLLCLQLHSLSLKLSLSTSPFAGSALVSFYANNGLPSHARKAFDEIAHKDEVCYGAAAVGLAHNDRPVEAVSVFRMMRSEGVPTTMYSVSGVLCAVSHVAALEQTRAVHAHTVSVGLNLNLVVGTALVDAYGKAGMVHDARNIFEYHVDSAPVAAMNVVMYNAMLAGYAQQGDAAAAIDLFHRMVSRHRDFAPDDFTFLAVLTACSNAGLVDDTAHWLDLMLTRYRIEPRIEHYTCLVGAMARVGKLEEAEQFISTMPVEPDAAVWRTLLSGCMVHRSVELARAVAKRLLDLNPRDESAYAMLANIYSSAGKKENMVEVCMEMRDQGVKKERGKSWVEVRGEVHEFVAGDQSHKQRKEIYERVRELASGAKRLGYKDEDEWVWYHSERLALAFAVVSGSAKGKEVRVLKNLRICKDCHEFFKYASRVLEREIVMRDVNRYHRFKDGGCSCRDYW